MENWKARVTSCTVAGELVMKGKENIHKCEVCQVIFKADHYKERHMLIHTGEKPFTFEICRKGFNRTDKLKAHRRIHENIQKPLDPNQFGSQADEKNVLKRTEINNFDDEDPYHLKMDTVKTRLDMMNLKSIPQIFCLILFSFTGWA